MKQNNPAPGEKAERGVGVSEFEIRGALFSRTVFSCCKGCKMRLQVWMKRAVVRCSH